MILVIESYQGGIVGLGLLLRIAVVGIRAEGRVYEDVRIYANGIDSADSNTGHVKETPFGAFCD